MKIKIKARPNASRNEIVGFMGDALKIRVNAPAESGQANKAIESLLAQKLELGKSQVRIISGLTKPNKIVEITGISETLFKERLAL